MQKQILELKEAKSQVTDVDALRLDLRQFCAELQQKVEMGLEVERQVSMRVAPLQQELDAVKVELQQSQPDVSNLETKVQRIEQATMQQAYQTNRAARQLRAKNAVLPNFCQAEHETPESLKRAKKKVFRARGKLAGCNVGLDDDLTPLQQKQKADAWDKFKEARASNLKTRWEAEKLYIKQGEEWGA
ncbi:TPA: hypothetical protein ACH3X3_003676 [Trebouxia sp. C0006]